MGFAGRRILAKPAAVISYTSGAAIKRHDFSATTNRRLRCEPENDDSTADVYDVHDVRYDYRICGRDYSEDYRPVSSYNDEAGAFHYAPMTAIALPVFYLVFWPTN